MALGSGLCLQLDLRGSSGVCCAGGTRERATSLAEGAQKLLTCAEWKAQCLPAMHSGLAVSSTLELGQRQKMKLKHSFGEPFCEAD